MKKYGLMSNLLAFIINVVLLFRQSLHPKGWSLSKGDWPFGTVYWQRLLHGLGKSNSICVLWNICGECSRCHWCQHWQGFRQTSCTSLAWYAFRWIVGYPYPRIWEGNPCQGRMPCLYSFPLGICIQSREARICIVVFDATYKTVLKQNSDCWPCQCLSPASSPCCSQLQCEWHSYQYIF